MRRAPLPSEIQLIRPILSDPCPVLFVSLSCPVSVTLLYCGQTVGRIKMKFGTLVGLVSGHIV